MYQAPPSPPQSPNSSPNTKPKLLGLGIFVLIIGMVCGYVISQALSNNKKNQPTEKTSVDAKKSVLAVEAQTPNSGLIQQTISADGSIEAKAVAKVGAKVNGVAIEKVLVDVGNRVKKGQVLAVFDTDGLSQQVVQAEADLAEAQASLTKASADVRRVVPLLKIDAVSQQEVDSYQTAEERAKAAVKSAKARLASQRLTLNNATVVAPVSGIISARAAEVGSVANGQSLFDIIVNGDLQWKAEIEPQQVSKIKMGTDVQVWLADGSKVNGTVSRIAPNTDQSRLISVYATLEPNSALRAGMYQSGEFLLGGKEEQTLPSSAIVTIDGYDYIMTLTELTAHQDETMAKVVRKKVNLGETIGDKVVVLDPIPSDTLFVNQGGAFLNDGDWVTVVQNQTNQISDKHEPSI